MTRRAIIITGSALALLILSVGAFAYTATPSFCGSCHEMAPLAAYWQHSQHAHMDCMECHAEPGMVGNIKTHLAGLEEVYLHFTGQYITPIRAEVKDTLCLKCHRGIENTNAVGDIVMVHGRHLHKDIHCTDCHALVAHRDPRSLVRNPAEEDCVNCHRQKDVAIECVTCHVQPVASKPKQ